MSATTPPAPAVASRSWAVRAWTLQLIGYVCAFGASIAVAVIALVNRRIPHPDAAISTLYQWSQWLMWPVAAVTLVLAWRWLRLSPSELGWRDPRPVRWGWPGAIAAAFAAQWIAKVTTGVLPGWHGVSATGDTPVSVWQEVEWSLRMGVIEETMLLALPLAIMHRLRTPWWAQILVLAALRTPFHLYQGSAEIAECLVWMALLYYVYTRVKLVWPLVIAHILGDLAITVLPAAPRFLLTIVLAIVGIVVLVSWWRARTPGYDAASTSTARA
ncbi:type II CAAX prenyl endopeptidase Rce1 family protein [Nocardia sp. NPDC058666]|uniref:CPBP family glutamic-type intramembrane protease n=1 Tax=Nocardia sp. NPDC058666 TaxID=3346587 RepID=UPI00365D5956